MTRSGTEDASRPMQVLSLAILVAAGALVYTNRLGLGAGLAGAGGLVFLLIGVRSTMQAVATLGMSSDDIGSLAGHDGAVQVEGTAEPVEGTVTAPMTGTECVAYRVTVDQYRARSGSED